MRRREFIALAGSMAAAWPVVTRAEQTRKVSRIGYLGTSSPSLEGHVLEAFRQKLRELGHVEGENVAIEYRWAEGQDDRLPDLATELVSLKPDVIVTRGTPGSGLVASYAHPEGNATGFTFTGPELEGKRLQILRELVPGLSRVAALWNPISMGVDFYRQTQIAATALSVTLQPVEAHRTEQAFAMIGRADAHAFIVLADPFLLSKRKQIAEFAANRRLPAMYPYREYVDAGGLSSYAPSTIDRLIRTAVYVDRILKGEKPADLPVEAPTKFELIINLKAAKAMGLTIPESFLLRAEEVIE